MKTNKKPTAAVAEINDRTAYSALINDHLNNNRPAYSPMFVQHKKGHVMKKKDLTNKSEFWGWRVCVDTVGVEIYKNCVCRRHFLISYSLYLLFRHFCRSMYRLATMHFITDRPEVKESNKLYTVNSTLICRHIKFKIVYS